MFSLLQFALCWLLYLQTCTALYVAKGTPCSSKCNSTGGSWWTDLVCSTDDFTGTSKGQVLQECLSCTIGSLYINSSYTDGNSDQFWSLFHMKYVQEYCLIDNTTPHIAAVNACTSACSPLSDVLDTLWINKHPFLGQYDYCTSDSSAYTAHAGDCARCLQSQEQSVILGNFVDTMNHACDARPLAASGELIVLNRELFDTVPLSSATVSTATATKSDLTSNPSSATNTASEAISTGTPSITPTGKATDNNTTSSSQGNQNTLSTGAAAGIGAGIAIVVIAAILVLGFIILRRRKRNSGRLKPQSVALELSSSHNPVVRQSNKHGFNIFEKSASSVDGQLHEAPTDSQSRLIELPAYSRR